MVGNMEVGKMPFRSMEVDDTGNAVPARACLVHLPPWQRQI
jgi:hypothetical protein